MAITALPIDLPKTRSYPVAIITLKNRTLTPVAQLFIDCARQVAKPLATGKSVSARRRQAQDTQSECPQLAVRPEGAKHLWRKNPPRKLSIDLEANERLGRVTGRAGAS
jgi:hypothetical protein